jgi:hypothetical protein
MVVIAKCHMISLTCVREEMRILLLGEMTVIAVMITHHQGISIEEMTTLLLATMIGAMNTLLATEEMIIHHVIEEMTTLPLVGTTILQEITVGQTTTLLEEMIIPQEIVVMIILAETTILLVEMIILQEIIRGLMTTLPVTGATTILPKGMITLLEETIIPQEIVEMTTMIAVMMHLAIAMNHVAMMTTHTLTIPKMTSLLHLKKISPKKIHNHQRKTINLYPNEILNLHHHSKKIFKPELT